MAHPLAELREYILDSQEPERIISMADSYLQTMDKLGARFILPQEHAYVKPILEYYFEDINGWAKYVRSIRDALPRGTAKRAEIQSVYRTIEIRAVQRERRDRLNAAVAVALKKGLIMDSHIDKQRYANRCTQEWSKHRAAMLDAHRKMTKANRLHEAERTELCDEFWTQIDAGIAAGEVPKP